jgi:hypothetical protein
MPASAPELYLIPGNSNAFLLLRTTSILVLAPTQPRISAGTGRNSFHGRTAGGKTCKTLIPMYCESFATGSKVRGSNPGGGEIFRTRPDLPWGPPNLLYDGYRVYFPEVKRPSRNVDHPPLLAPRLKKEYSYTPTPPLGLRCLF